jgi:hypothetical protein
MQNNERARGARLGEEPNDRLKLAELARRLSGIGVIKMTRRVTRKRRL